MSTMGTIALNDGSADKNFYPMSRSNGVAQWSETSAASYDLRPACTFSVTPPKTGGVVGRVKAKVTFPYLATDGILRTGTVNFDAVIPKDMVVADRTKLRNFAKNFIGNAVLQVAFDNFEDVV